MKLKRLDRVTVNGEFCYLLAFVLYYGAMFYDTTMFVHSYPTAVTDGMRLAALMLLLMKMVVWDRFSPQSLAGMAVLVVLAVLSYWQSTYIAVLAAIAFVVAAKEVSFDKVLKATILVGVSFTIVAMLASQVGIIEDLVYRRGDGSDVVRHSFGSVYTTNFASHIFYFLLAHFYLKRGRLSFCNVLVYLGVALFLQVFCNTRLNIVLILLILAAAALYPMICRYQKQPLVRWMLTASVPLGAAAAIGVCAAYNPKNPLMAALNGMLSRRLQYSRKVLDRYEITLFGQYVEQHGNGGTTETISQRVLEYSYIDISYLRILFMYGIAVLVVLCVGYMIFCHRRLKQNDVLLPLCILFVAVSSMIDQHLIDFSYNPFLYFFAMKLYTPEPDGARASVPAGRPVRLTLAP